MATELDPTGVEWRTVGEIARLQHCRVLEVGAGDGRLTFRYANETQSVVAIDTKETEIRTAARSCPTALRDMLHFLYASASALPFPSHRFDVVLFSSSL
jgi:ubiquinone/menaquinone biosynthesis C-methylase UbiE